MCVCPTICTDCFGFDCDMKARVQSGNEVLPRVVPMLLPLPVNLLKRFVHRDAIRHSGHFVSIKWIVGSVDVYLNIANEAN